MGPEEFQLRICYLLASTGRGKSQPISLLSAHLAIAMAGAVIVVKAS
jgi:hypothetical protein